MGNRFLVFASISGFIAVALGALVAHRLEATWSASQLMWFEKAWRYQVFHSLALLVLGFYSSATQSSAPACRKRAVNFIGIFWCLGIIGFSGGLYAMALGQVHEQWRGLVMIVPMGGIAFLIGWAVLIYVSIRNSLLKQK